ncbi:MAG: hypothetical protein RIS64_4203, partial [Bacteroidota bacterium]
MTRKEFFQNSLILGGATILPTKGVLAANNAQNGLDKLVDAQGNFVLQPLPFKENFLEPFMDEETVH